MAVYAVGDAVASQRQPVGRRVDRDDWLTVPILNANQWNALGIRPTVPAFENSLHAFPVGEDIMICQFGCRWVMFKSHKSAHRWFETTFQPTCATSNI